MKIGIGLPTFASDAHRVPPTQLAKFASTAEEYGFAGAWLIDHLLPTPTYASSLLDPLTTLAYVASETETLPLGTSILILPLREPVLVAKRAATVHHLSDGRLTLGLGTGYVDAEFDAVGIPSSERSPRFREGLRLVRSLLSNRSVTFDGEYYSVTDVRLEPTLRRPPRLLVGGGGIETEDGRVVRESVTERIRYADGWIAPPRAADDLATDWAAFEGFLESISRDSERADKVLLQYLHLTSSDDPDRANREQRAVYRDVLGPNRSINHAMTHWLTGTADDVRSTLATYERQGFDEVILHPMVRSPAALNRQLRLYRDELVTVYP